MSVADIRIRTIALEAVLKASASIKGWEVKSGGELIAEATHIAGWLKTGKQPFQSKGKK